MGAGSWGSRARCPPCPSCGAVWMPRVSLLQFNPTVVRVWGASGGFGGAAPPKGSHSAQPCPTALLQEPQRRHHPAGRGAAGDGQHRLRLRHVGPLPTALVLPPSSSLQGQRDTSCLGLEQGWGSAPFVPHLVLGRRLPLVDTGGAGSRSPQSLTGMGDARSPAQLWAVPEGVKAPRLLCSAGIWAEDALSIQDLATALWLSFPRAQWGLVLGAAPHRWRGATDGAHPCPIPAGARTLKPTS